eukprot:923957-Alexandrium_andersonii.AAC.1
MRRNAAFPPWARVACGAMRESPWARASCGATLRSPLGNGRPRRNAELRPRAGLACGATLRFPLGQRIARGAKPPPPLGK